nr:hypothetical protein [Tanacetum cinerariifolium]
MLQSIKVGNEVLNPVPLFAFNLSIGHVVKDTASDVVKEIPKDKIEILKEKPNDKTKGVTHKVSCVDNLKDKVSDIVKEKPKDKLNGVIDKASCVDTVKDKVSDIVKEKPKDKPKGVTDKVPCVDNVKDKVSDIVVKSKVPKDKVSDIVDNVKDKRKTELLKDKAKGRQIDNNSHSKAVLDVINEKRKTEVMKDKPKDKAPSVVKSKVSIELYKDKADLPKDKSKHKDKNNVKLEVPILRSKSKSKKIKTKAVLKRKMKGGSDSDSFSLNEEKVMRMLKKLKKIKKEDSNEESGLKSKKKGKKKEKLLPPEEAAHQKYLRFFPTLRARIVSASLFSAIRSARVDMWSFFVINRLSLDSGDYVEVTPSKVHILSIPVGGDSLFSFEERPIEFDFEVDFIFKVNFLTLFTNTMGKVTGLREQVCLYVVRRLRKDCVISKIDWCGYIYSYLEDSKLSKKRTVQCVGPFTFLILYHIKDWTSTLMR